MLAALQYGSAAIPHTECLGKRRNLNTSRTGETVSDRARPRRRPVSSNPVPLHDAGPPRAGGSGELQTERPTSDGNLHRLSFSVPFPTLVPWLRLRQSHQQTVGPFGPPW